MWLVRLHVGWAINSDYLIPTNLVCILFGIAIPTSSFNFIQLFLYLFIIELMRKWLTEQIHTYIHFLNRHRVSDFSEFSWYNSNWLRLQSVHPDGVSTTYDHDWLAGEITLQILAHYLLWSLLQYLQVLAEDSLKRVSNLFIFVIFPIFWKFSDRAIVVYASYWSGGLTFEAFSPRTILLDSDHTKTTELLGSSIKMCTCSLTSLASSWPFGLIIPACPLLCENLGLLVRWWKHMSLQSF